MKLSTIGTSMITQLMLDHSKEIDGIERIASYSRSLEKAQDFANKYGFQKAYDNLDEMFADPDTDTIYIASPNTLHYPQAKKALQAGKNVILEKPFVSTVEEAKDLFETAEANHVMIFEAITNIHTPNFGLLKDQLDRAGNIKLANLNYSQYSSRYDKYRQGIVENAFDPNMEGGALADINVYNLHLAVGLFGKPKRITYYPNIGFNGIDTSGVAVLEYPDFQVVCTGAKDSATKFNAWISGDDGAFYITKAGPGIMEEVEFIPTHPPKDVDVISIDQGPHMAFEMMDFLVALNENNQEMYEQYKDQTLTVMELVEEAKRQREAYKA